jgi:clan AA aspartic protease (TIGR02281 family)
MVPVEVNGRLTVEFLIDSGASDVFLPEHIVRKLTELGTVDSSDALGERSYSIADGSTFKATAFRIRTMRIGDRSLENETGNVARGSDTPLLGQSFLGRFKSWSIDNQRHVLMLDYPL